MFKPFSLNFKKKKKKPWGGSEDNLQKSLLSLPIVNSEIRHRSSSMAKNTFLRWAIFLVFTFNFKKIPILFYDKTI